jgi:hypothetical protein
MNGVSYFDLFFPGKFKKISSATSDLLRSENYRTNRIIKKRALRIYFFDPAQAAVSVIL